MLIILQTVICSSLFEACVTSS